MSKLVKAPLVIAKRDDGSDVYVYQGSPLPSGLAAGEEKRLADYLEDGDADSTDDGVPAKSATKAEWEAFARAQGATDEDLDGKTKDELVSAYGA